MKVILDSSVSLGLYFWNCSPFLSFFFFCFIFFCFVLVPPSRRWFWTCEWRVMSVTDLSEELNSVGYSLPISVNAGQVGLPLGEGCLAPIPSEDCWLTEECSSPGLGVGQALMLLLPMWSRRYGWAAQQSFPSATSQLITHSYLSTLLPEPTGLNLGVVPAASSLTMRGVISFHLHRAKCSHHGCFLLSRNYLVCLEHWFLLYSTIW